MDHLTYHFGNKICEQIDLDLKVASGVYNDTSHNTKMKPKLSKPAIVKTHYGPVRRSPRFANKLITHVSADPGILSLSYGRKKIVDPKELVQGVTGIAYDDKMNTHFCEWDVHFPEKPSRYFSIIKRFKQLGLIERCTSIPVTPASKEEVMRLHDEDMLNILEASQFMSVDEREALASNYDSVYFHPESYKAAMLAVGSTLNLVNAIVDGNIQNGMAIVRPPGHHAMKSEFCGFCYFNNVAIAAQHCLDTGKSRRILILDWDVHHGQGIQQLFYSDPRVLYFSVHRYENGLFWPHLRESDFDYIGDGCGIGCNFNVPLNETGRTNEDYLAIFHQVLMPVAYEYQPDLIIVSGGFDAAFGCPEGDMKLSPMFYAHMTSALMGLACGKVMVVLEGGYCDESLAESAAMTLKTLLGDPCPDVGRFGTPSPSVKASILNTIYSHRCHWKCFPYQNTVEGKENDDSCKHWPSITFLGLDERPTKFPTRDVHISKTEEWKSQTSLQLSLLLSNVKLTYPSNKLCIVYDEFMLKHFNEEQPNHPERPDRITAVLATMEEYAVLQRSLCLQSRKATREEVLLVHTLEHFKMLESLSIMKSSELLKLGDSFKSVYLCENSHECALLAAGSLLQVVDAVMAGISQAGIAVIRPPGHHAEEQEPCGFCLYNNVAMAAKYGLEVHGLQRVLILDWDVHHGNGTQHIFETDPRVLYISIHRYDDAHFFPHSKDANYDKVGEMGGKGYNVNIPWNKRGMGDVEYMTAFFQVVLPIAYQFNPQLILVSAGFDAAKGDPLGGCRVSPEAYGHFTRFLMPLADGKVILSLEGGYNLTSTSLSLTNCAKTLLCDPCPPVNTCGVAPSQSAVDSIRNVVQVHREYWDSLCFHTPLPPDHQEADNLVCLKEETPEPPPPVDSMDVVSAKRSTSLSSSCNSSVSLEEPPVNTPRAVTPPVNKLPYFFHDYTPGKCVLQQQVDGGLTPNWHDRTHRHKNPDNQGTSDTKPSGGQQETATGSSMVTQTSGVPVQGAAASEVADGSSQFGSMYAVIPLSWCPHVQFVEPVPEGGLDTSSPCIECQTVIENWVCLTCYQVHCSRYVSGHMMQHHQETGHFITLSYADLSAWCYGCESYVHHEGLLPAKHAAHLSKFKEPYASS